MNWKITPDNDSITRCKDYLGVGVFGHGAIHTTLLGMLGHRVTGITTRKDDKSTEVIIFQNRTPQEIRSVHNETLNVVSLHLERGDGRRSRQT